MKTHKAKDVWPGMVIEGHEPRGKVAGMGFHNSHPDQPVSIVFADGSHVTLGRETTVTESSFAPSSATSRTVVECVYGEPFRLADSLEDDGTVSYATVRKCEDCGHLDVVA